MQQRSCVSMQVLLSKYADNEATPAERERVAEHVASCVSCTHRLAEYRQAGAIFAASPAREPEPQVRVGLFREISRLKQEEIRERHAHERRPWYLRLPLAQVRNASGAPTRFGRLWLAASPFVAAAMIVLVLWGLATVVNKPPSVKDKDVVYLPPVPTAAVPIAYENNTGSTGSPPNPVATSVGVLASPVSVTSATALPANGGPVVDVSQPTPILEEDDPAK